MIFICNSTSIINSIEFFVVAVAIVVLHDHNDGDDDDE